MMPILHRQGRLARLIWFGALVVAPGVIRADLLTTTQTPSSTVVGSVIALKDIAHLSGGSSPTGTITFQLFNSASAVVDTETVPVSGIGDYTTPVGYVPTAAGTYQWAAAYSGDPNNNPASSTIGAEPVLVNVASPSLTTTATPGSSGRGIALKDIAHLSGGFDPTGTITFQFFNSASVVVDTETVPVSGNGDYTTPVGYPPTAPGTYQWAVTYSGDPNNNAAGSPIGTEPVSVTGPSLTTTQTPADTVLGSGIALKDIAHLSGGFDPTGTITFQFFDPTSLVVDTETVPVGGNGDYTTPVGYVPTVAGTYQWEATYNGDTNNFAAASVIGTEPASVTGKVPEPSSVSLLCVAIAGLGFLGTHRKKAKARV